MSASSRTCSTIRAISATRPRRNFCRVLSIASRHWSGNYPGRLSYPSHPLRPARDGDDAGARDFDQADRQHQRDKTFDLLGSAGDLEHEAFGGGVDNAGTKRVGEAERLHAVLVLAAHLDHGKLALDRRPSCRDIDDS